jgi:hypothetical protein
MPGNDRQHQAKDSHYCCSRRSAAGCRLLLPCCASTYSPAAHRADLYKYIARSHAHDLAVKEWGCCSTAKLPTSLTTTLPETGKTLGMHMCYRTSKHFGNVISFFQAAVDALKLSPDPEVTLRL